jgi:seryl-tRNA synthetase
MLDIKFIRENKDIVKAGAHKKHVEIDLDKLLSLDEERRELQKSIDDKRAEQNQASDAIARAGSDEERQILIAQMQDLKERLKKDEEKMQKIMPKWRAFMVQVPNVPDISVPEGQSDADNQEVRQWPAPSEVDTFESLILNPRAMSN